MFPAAFGGLDAQQRHAYILKTYVLQPGNCNDQQTQRGHKRDLDIIKENHKFLWNDEDDGVADTWETRLARKYYDKLFKEYCIADLSRYKENKIAMRWRVEQEVVCGKGQFECGARKCNSKETLRSWEVNFGYMERGIKKNALVKLRLCVEHSAQLNYTTKKREIKRQKHTEMRRAKEEKRRKRGKVSNEATTKTTKAAAVVVADEKMNEESSLASSSSDANSDDEAANSTHRENITAENAAAQADIWTKKPEIELETNTREADFERYLEDLLL